MSGKLSPRAQVRLTALQQMSEKVQHVHGLVERFAAVRDPNQAEQLAPPLKRAFGKLKRDFTGIGLDSLSQLAGAMEIAAGRGGGSQTKTRILREGVGSLRFQVDFEQRKVISDDEAEQADAAAREREG